MTLRLGRVTVWLRRDPWWWFRFDGRLEPYMLTISLTVLTVEVGCQILRQGVTSERRHDWDVGILRNSWRQM